MKEEVKLNRKDQNRVIVMSQGERKRLTIDKTVMFLQFSLRPLWRLLAAYRREGASALANGDRTKKSVNMIETYTRQQGVDLAKGV
ncbi:MAG: hypothetical protein NTV30_05745 [Chloroflexi bacterium]|nr:hypothetical protein [Chloroflexota bacterium]